MIDTDGGHCGFCGEPLPERCNLRRKYCDGKCRQSFYTAKNWADVTYCSRNCSDRSQNDTAKTRCTCRQREKAYRGHGPFCWHDFYAESRRIARVPCPPNRIQAASRAATDLFARLYG
ncbi:MAG: hypothetical protein DI616_03160 [Paracoccus denitrificans]|uniref:Uncharacterized protein n=1 Tax=Paracoccus denitrificans TaxID=266 RepID=A0A533IEW8_PARDE|nr:MAG: hypothetical protein DI616_03160 [Paracoccus denitrificans]